MRVGAPTKFSALLTAPGPWGDFWSGVLMALLASPCIGPFMGPALAYGLAAGGVGAIGVFVALGLGLAFPFALLACTPALARLLPKPGPWMETVKLLLALPMLLSAVWLVYVLAGQIDDAALALFLASLVSGAFLLWLGSRQADSPRHATRVLFTATATIAIACGLLMAGRGGDVTADHAWKGMTYSARDLSQLQGEQRKVLLAVTARWCATCIANEQLVLGTQRAADLLADNEVVLMRADYTDNDPMVSELLRKHGAAGVPLYVLYHEDGRSEQLPQVLTMPVLEAPIQGEG